MHGVNIFIHMHSKKGYGTYLVTDLISKCSSNHIITLKHAVCPTPLLYKICEHIKASSHPRSIFESLASLTRALKLLKDS